MSVIFMSYVLVPTKPSPWRSPWPSMGPPPARCPKLVLRFEANRSQRSRHAVWCGRRHWSGRSGPLTKKPADRKTRGQRNGFWDKNQAEALGSFYKNRLKSWDIFRSSQILTLHGLLSNDIQSVCWSFSYLGTLNKTSGEIPNHWPDQPPTNLRKLRWPLRWRACSLGTLKDPCPDAEPALMWPNLLC